MPRPNSPPSPGITEIDLDSIRNICLRGTCGRIWEAITASAAHF